MAKNWSDYFLQNTNLPETVDEAVERLMTVLEDEEKSEIRSMTAIFAHPLEMVKISNG